MPETNNIQEITIFTDGDSNDPRVFSNVPYFFTKTLLSRGVRVNRINISPCRFFERIYHFCIFPFIKRFYPGSSYTYFRTSFHFWDVTRRIKKAIKTHPTSDLSLFLTFSFSPATNSTVPVALFGDRPYCQVFKHFISRPPDCLERKAIERENQQIENADFVFVLFPKTAEEMKVIYSNKRIFYLGNVINALREPSETESIRLKESSDILLFIGGETYLEGATTLILAFTELKKRHSALSVHFIGLSRESFKQIPEDVFFHAYLNKGNLQDCETYYQLVKKAKILVNTTPKWGAFSSALEAMYFYTPVITTPYNEFVDTFGSTIPFGLYCEENEAFSVIDQIETILTTNHYGSMCMAAHAAAKEFTWENYVDRFLEIINKS